MSGIKQYGWMGAGDGYVMPGACGVNLRTANQTPRWWPRDYGMSSMIMSGGVQNRCDFASVHAGVESEAIKAYKQNFQS